MLDVSIPGGITLHLMTEADYTSPGQRMTLCGQLGPTWLLAQHRLPRCGPCAAVEARWTNARSLADEVMADRDFGELR